MVADFRFSTLRAALEAGASASDIMRASHARCRALAGEGLFTALVEESVLEARLAALEARKARGEALPLYGLPFSVKDNIHVAGLRTTCNCPGLALEPAQSATVVRKLEAAGAVLVGKNTLDQFATGLNGTRTPEPLCRNAVNPAYIPGGSSSGSAVAVAREAVAFALGSDTGGSGRVPAACNGIIGLKPSLGLVSTAGLVYNSRFFDVVPVFAARVEEAAEILAHIRGYDPADDFARLDADSIALEIAAPAQPRIAVPRADLRRFFGDAAAEEAFTRDLALLRAMGAELVEIDDALFHQAGAQVFQSAMVAERLDAYAQVMRERPETIHPAVRQAIEPGAHYSALEAFQALYALQGQRRAAHRLLAGFDAYVVPTVATIYTIEAMLADPMAKNAVMGTYTYFANPLDLCAISVPGAGRSDGLPSALCFNAPAGQDAMILALARAFERARSVA